MLPRRRFLASAACSIITVAAGARARVLSGHLPFVPGTGDPPHPAAVGPWLFFTGAEGEAVEALANRIIPPDPSTPGGKDAGCAVFLDRQLAGPYGRNEGQYIRPPFMKAAKNFGAQSETDMAKKYRGGLAALDRYCVANKSGKRFAELTDDAKDDVLQGLEDGKIKLEGADGKEFLEQAVKDIQMGFFADPIYGGNRDMCAWKMIGFPGVRYNYLDWVDRHNEPFPLPPVSMTGRAEWTRG